MVKRAAEKQLTRENALASDSSDKEDIGPRAKASAEVLAQRKIIRVTKSNTPNVPEPKGGESPKKARSPSKPVSPPTSPTKTASPSPKKEPSPTKNPFAALLTPLPTVGASPAATAIAPDTNGGLYPSATLAPTKSIFGDTSKFTGNLFATFGSFGSGPFARPDDEKATDSEEAEDEAAEEVVELPQQFSGEEDERCLYQHDCKIFFLEISEKVGRWVEKGSGFVRVLENEKTGKKRIVVRMKGVLKILLNTPVIEDKSHKLEGVKSVKFKALISKDACATASEEGSLSMAWVRLNLLQEGQQEAFVNAAFP